MDRDGGGVLTEDEGGVRGDGVVLTEDAMRPSVNEKIFLVCKEEDSGQDSVSVLLFT